MIVQVYALGSLKLLATPVVVCMSFKKQTYNWHVVFTVLSHMSPTLVKTANAQLRQKLQTAKSQLNGLRKQVDTSMLRLGVKESQLLPLGLRKATTGSLHDRNNVGA